jgi:hypothetical protein
VVTLAFTSRLCASKGKRNGLTYIFWFSYSTL